MRWSKWEVLHSLVFPKVSFSLLCDDQCLLLQQSEWEKNEVLPALNNKKSITQTQKRHEIVLRLFRVEISYFFVHIPIFNSLWSPLVCANSQSSSDAILAPTTGVLARKPDWDQIAGWVTALQLVRRVCSFSSNSTILFNTLLSPTLKFFPSYQLDSPSPTAIQTFGNLCLSPYVLFAQSLPLIFKWTFFLHSGALGKI